MMTNLANDEDKMTKTTNITKRHTYYREEIIITTSITTVTRAPEQSTFMNGFAAEIKKKTKQSFPTWGQGRYTSITEGLRERGANVKIFEI